MTAVRVDRAGGTGGKKGKGSAKEYVCITHRQRQQCAGSQTEGRGGGEGMGASVIVSTIKIKFKKSV